MGATAEVLAALAVLRRGGLVALPTETVYGLGADAENDGAVARIFTAKGRPASHPLIVHVGPDADLGRWADEVPVAAQELARAFWPGPLTLILPRRKRPALAATGGQPSIGLRVPDHPLALELLREFGGGIAAPSANRFGRVSPTRAEHVRAELGAAVDWVLDGGPCQVGVESTIVDFSAGPPRILRPGGVPAESLERVLGEAVPFAPSPSDIRAPGLMASHYAPRARLVIAQDRASLERQVDAARAQGQRAFGLLSTGGEPAAAGANLYELGADVAASAHNLYAALRHLDAQGAELIVALPPPVSGLGAAILDRLSKAAGPR